MYYLAAAQQTSTVKLSAFFLRFQTEKWVLRVNKSEITSENSSNGDFVGIEDNYESSKDERTCF